MLRVIHCGAAALMLAAMTPSASAETVTYRAELSGASEVPPNGTQGRGEITAIYDPATNTLSWKGSYSGLTGTATAAHFHGPAEPGKNAGVLVPAPAAASPFSGSAQIDAAKAADLEAGKVYFNIHTAANPGGELRGQLMQAR